MGSVKPARVAKGAHEGSWQPRDGIIVVGLLRCTESSLFRGRSVSQTLSTFDSHDGHHVEIYLPFMYLDNQTEHRPKRGDIPETFNDACAKGEFYYGDKWKALLAYPHQFLKSNFNRLSLSCHSVM